MSGCASLPTPDQRRGLADTLARERGWQAARLPGAPFDLVAYLPSWQPSSEQLTVYIEGDGFAWVTPSQPSSDPTPLNPIGLKMALAHPGGNVAYLARPCQYIDAQASRCPKAYWTARRFAPVVIEATSTALDLLKRRFHAKRVTLVGYSGGGAVAALLAARRTDVERLVTAAGNLDHRAWTRHHRITPLTGSLNPADDWQRLASIPQVHFAGSRDRVVPLRLIQGFIALYPATGQAQVRVIPGYDHRCCWADNWAGLWSQIQ